MLRISFSDTILIFGDPKDTNSVIPLASKASSPTTSSLTSRISNELKSLIAFKFSFIKINSGSDPVKAKKPNVITSGFFKYFLNYLKCK